MRARRLEHVPPIETPSGHRRAITLIELMVVISLIGILMALLLVAVQSARESARRLQCVSNLRQIGVALHAYNGTYGRFPPGKRSNSRGMQWGDLSTFASVLPYLEQRPLYDTINAEFGPYDTAERPALENRTARRTTVALFLCPSDGEPNHRVNYRFNRGRRLVDRESDGPFALKVVLNEATVRDGLSQTAFVSERIAGNFIPGSADSIRNIAYPAGPLEGRIRSDAQFIRRCLAYRPRGWQAVSGRYWIYSGYVNTNYNHNGTPNDPRPSCGTGTLQDWPQLGLHPPRSFHPNHVNVLFGDGHVRAVSDSVDKATWVRMGTHDSGD